MAADAERERVAAAAYEHVVASGRWTYRRLVEDVEAVLPAAARRRASRPAVAASRALDSVSKPLLPLAARVLMPLRRRLYSRLRLRGYGPAEQKG